jgi:hypothetical protein
MGVRTWRQLLAITIAVAVVAPTASDAAQRGRARSQRIERGGWPATLGPEAYDRGYRDGVRQGEADARSGRPFDRSATQRDGFGTGFADGYRAGYDREFARTPQRGRRDSSVFVQRAPRVYQEPAFASGFNGGYERGLRDGRDGGRYDPVRHSDYRDADHGYRSSYGSKDAYKNNYRAGFRQGYEQGYRDGTRSRR